MPAGKCVFNTTWLDDPRFKTWLRQIKGDKHKANCIICFKAIDLGNMGEAALKSHMKCTKHISASKSGTLCDLTLFGRPTSSVKSEVSDSSSTSEIGDVGNLTVPVPPQAPLASCSNAQSTNSISKFTGKDVLIAEIIWTLRTILCHQSYKSNENITEIFKLMFPDSGIAQTFTCAERKTSYVAVFGISEHFQKLLKMKITGPFVVLFDESLNKKLQKKQMDIHLRYWDEQCHKVVTRYFTSEFLGHATSEDMVQHFTTVVLESGLAMKNLIQISMDGPNVNWKFYDIIKKKLSDDYEFMLINIGSCGLHILHNCFKSGVDASKWQVSSYLSSSYYLFKDSPARRDDFVSVTNTSSSFMPLKFVSHRWLENVPVCERALELWDNMGLYVKAAEEKKVTRPSNKSFEVISTCVKDKFFPAKLHFFLCIAKQLQPFLTLYQTDRPMVPFIAEDLCELIKSLLMRFVDPEKLNVSDEALMKLDLDDKKLFLPLKKLDIGFACERVLKEIAKGPPTVSERQLLEFKTDCRLFLVAVAKKMMFKSPAIYSLVRNLTCLNPLKMGSKGSKEQCKSMFKKVLRLMVNAKIVKETDCDRLHGSYVSFLEKIPQIGSEKFTSFRKDQDSLDELLYECMLQNDKYTELFQFIKIFLIMSHGQAAVERGFSINKEVETENMVDKTIVAHRVTRHCE